MPAENWNVATSPAETQPVDDVLSVPVNDVTTHHLERRPWLYSLFACCGKCDSCLEAYFCFFCQLSRQYNMFYNLQPFIHLPFCVCLVLSDWMLSNIPSCLLVWSLRSDIRERYSIRGSSLGDCTVSMCCTTCALQQQLLEMTVLGSFPGAFCYHESPDYVTMM